MPSFANPSDEFQLDPSYEFTNDPSVEHSVVAPYADPHHVAIFKELQLFERVGNESRFTNLLSQKVPKLFYQLAVTRDRQSRGCF